MIRQSLAAIMIIALTLAVVGPAGIAAAAPSPSLQSPFTRSIAVQNAVAGINAEAAAIVRSVSAKSKCNRHPHRANASCSLDALHIPPETLVPSRGFRVVTWSVGSEHLNRTFLDPGFRPPIPVS